MLAYPVVGMKVWVVFNHKPAEFTVSSQSINSPGYWWVKRAKNRRLDEKLFVRPREMWATETDLLKEWNP